MEGPTLLNEEKKLCTLQPSLILVGPSCAELVQTKERKKNYCSCERMQLGKQVTWPLEPMGQVNQVRIRGG